MYPPHDNNSLKPRGLRRPSKNQSISCENSASCVMRRLFDSSGGVAKKDRYPLPDAILHGSARRRTETAAGKRVWASIGTVASVTASIMPLRLTVGWTRNGDNVGKESSVTRSALSRAHKNMLLSQPADAVGHGKADYTLCPRRRPFRGKHRHFLPESFLDFEHGPDRNNRPCCCEFRVLWACEPRPY